MEQLKQNDPEFLPAEYSLTQVQLVQLAEEYDPSLIPEAKAVGDEGYVEIHEKVMAITKVRTNVERKRKDLKRDALAWGRLVDGEAKRLTGIVEDLESPWRAVKTELDAEERRLAEEKLAAEQARVAQIEGNIADIRSRTEGLLNMTADAIAARMADLDSIEITEEAFGEFTEAATAMCSAVDATLHSAYRERLAFEESQARLAEDRAILKKEQEALKREQDKLASENAAREAAQRAVEALEAEAAMRQASVESEPDEPQAEPEGDKLLEPCIDKDAQRKLLHAFADRLDMVPIVEGEITDHGLITVLDDALDYLQNAVETLRKC